MAFRNAGRHWKFRHLSPALGRPRLGHPRQGHGFETLLSKYIENSEKTPVLWGERRPWGPHRPQPLRARTPETEARLSCGPSRGPRTVWDTRGCGRTATQRRSGPSRRAQGPQDARARLPAPPPRCGLRGLRAQRRHRGLGAADPGGDRGRPGQPRRFPPAPAPVSSRRGRTLTISRAPGSPESFL